MNQYLFIAMYLICIKMQCLMISINTLLNLWFGVISDVLSGSGTMYSCCVMHSLHMVCAPCHVLWY